MNLLELRREGSTIYSRMVCYLEPYILGKVERNASIELIGGAKDLLEKLLDYLHIHSCGCFHGTNVVCDKCARFPLI